MGSIFEELIFSKRIQFSLKKKSTEISYKPKLNQNRSKLKTMRNNNFGPGFYFFHIKTLYLSVCVRRINSKINLNHRQIGEAMCYETK